MNSILTTSINLLTTYKMFDFKNPWENGGKFADWLKNIWEEPSEESSPILESDSSPDNEEDSEVIDQSETSPPEFIEFTFRSKGRTREDNCAATVRWNKIKKLGIYLTPDNYFSAVIEITAAVKNAVQKTNNREIYKYEFDRSKAVKFHWLDKDDKWQHGVTNSSSDDLNNFDECLIGQLQKKNIYHYYSNDRPGFPIENPAQLDETSLANNLKFKEVVCNVNFVDTFICTERATGNVIFRESIKWYVSMRTILKDDDYVYDEKNYLVGEGETDLEKYLL